VKGGQKNDFQFLPIAGVVCYTAAGKRFPVCQTDTFLIALCFTPGIESRTADIRLPARFGLGKWLSKKPFT
jgi:hypothetical protein